MNHRFRTEIVYLLLMWVLILAACGCSAYWAQLREPVPMADAPTDHIACVSYAPFRKSGESPFKPDIVPESRIDEDLKALSRRFDCVRTYAQGNGLNVVPVVARRYGMKVLLGVWLGRDESANAREIAHAAQTVALDKASGAPVIRALVVGNEVMLRGELTQQQLVADIRKAAAATGMPVTYADVWEFWLKYPDVQNAVSFITIHILPYWEDAPVPIEEAVPHVKQIYDHMQQRFPDKKLLIGETGWPSAGRQRWGAVPSLVNQARFFREFMQFAAKSHVDYNVIEAFDQPWKRALEGTVGGYWGIYDGDLNEKFPQHGAVTEDSHVAIALIISSALMLLLLVTGLGIPGLIRPKLKLDRSFAILLASGSAGGSALTAQWRHMLFSNRTIEEWSIGLVWTALEAITIIFGAYALARAACLRAASTDTETAQQGDNDALVHVTVPALLSQLKSARGFDRWLGLLRGLWLVAASVVCVLLVVDARYRDFPNWMFGPAVAVLMLVFIAQMAAGSFPPRQPMRRGDGLEEKLMCIWLLVGSVWIVILEKISNTSALTWAGICVVLAVCSYPWRKLQP